MEKLPTRDEICAVLDYDPKTGIFRWKKRVAYRVYVGDVAGSVHSLGYRCLRIKDRSLRANRVAWLIMTGEWPPKGFRVDHKDRNKANDRWRNLRLATHAQNRANSKSSAKSGFKGVVKTRFGRYAARITFNKKNIHIGNFLTPEEAHAAYMKVARRLHGEFARAS